MTEEIPKEIEIIIILRREGLLERVDAEIIKKGIEHLDDLSPYNALGAIYPNLTREQRDKALRGCLSEFDGINYILVQANHTPYIREPLLLADICIARHLYWPGLDEGREVIKTHGTFEEFQSIMMPDGTFNPEKVRSDFCVAYAVLRNNRSKYGSEYAKACHPDFLNRVVKAAVALRFGWCETEADEEKGIAHLQELLPQELHPLIDKYRQEKDWVDKSEFP